jgi:hypothetical protein
MSVLEMLKKPIRFILIVVCLISLLCFPGCKNPFRTRSSPPPITETGGTWKPPSYPQDVIDNLLNAYNEMVISNFNRCLCDSFRFSAPEDSIAAVQDNREELFADWDRNTEESVTAKIFNTFRQNPDSMSYLLIFNANPPTQDNTTDTTAVLLREYEISILDLNADPNQKSAKGTATFHMQKTPLNWWCILFWSDIPAEPGGFDWGDFKAQSR